LRLKVPSALVLGALALCPGRNGVAEEVTVPANLQAELFAKAAAYDEQFLGRTEGVVRILVVVRAGDAESERMARRFMATLATLRTIVNLPHEESVERFKDADSLADVCLSKRITFVYLGPGLDAAVPAIADAMKGSEILTVAAVPSYVGRGVVMGFDLASGRLQILVHLTQMRAQKARLAPALLRLAKVIE
jgi:hypothetical protein